MFIETADTRRRSPPLLGGLLADGEGVLQLLILGGRSHPNKSAAGGGRRGTRSARFHPWPSCAHVPGRGGMDTRRRQFSCRGKSVFRCLCERALLFNLVQPQITNIAHGGRSAAGSSGTI
jgi:hypothetical protein